MGAAVLQGVPVVTQDLDLWIGQPMGRHDQLLLICRDLGAEITNEFEVALPDNSVVNFTYHVDGLGTFEEELKRARRLTLRGIGVPVLPLDRICASKEALNRPKDRAHLFYLYQAIRLKARLKPVRKRGLKKGSSQTRRHRRRI